MRGRGKSIAGIVFAAVMNNLLSEPLPRSVQDWERLRLRKAAAAPPKPDKRAKIKAARKQGHK